MLAQKAITSKFQGEIDEEFNTHTHTHTHTHTSLMSLCIYMFSH